MRINKEEIKKARLAIGMSQEDFGNKLGMSGSSVSMLEKGLTSPINIDESDCKYGAWNAMLSGDEKIIENLPNPIAAWLKRIRTSRSMSIKQLASKSDVGDHMIRAIERGDSPSNRAIVQELELALGEKAPINLVDASQDNIIPGIGTLEDFNPHNVDERPLCAGIYVFYDISDRPIYIGESSNIRKRIKQHEEKFWFKPPLVEYAAYINVNDDKLRKGIEQILINFLRSNAVLNKQHVSRD